MRASPRSLPGDLPLSTAKGSNFLGLLRAVDKLHGPDARARVFANAPSELADSLEQGQILAVGWYPVTWYAELHAAIDRALHAGPLGARTLATEAMTADLGSVHRLLASVLSVETVFGQTPRLMGLYWKGGQVERKDLLHGYARLRFLNWSGFSRLVWEDVMGSCEGILSFCGAKHVRTHAAGMLDDRQQNVEIELRWS